MIVSQSSGAPRCSSHMSQLLTARLLPSSCSSSSSLFLLLLFFFLLFLLLLHHNIPPRFARSPILKTCLYSYCYFKASTSVQCVSEWYKQPQEIIWTDQNNPTQIPFHSPCIFSSFSPSLPDRVPSPLTGKAWSSWWLTERLRYATRVQPWKQNLARFSASVSLTQVKRKSLLK